MNPKHLDTKTLRQRSEKFYCEGFSGHVASDAAP
jgi:hypothetical protein